MSSKKKSLFQKFLGILIKIIDLVIKRINLRILNVLKKLILSFKADVIFVVEDFNWVIKWVGIQITENLNKLGLLNSEITTPLLARNKIIHYGSINCLFTPKGFIKTNHFNKNVVTWFHILPNDKRLNLIPILNRNIDLLHTSNTITKKILIESGFPEEKIVIVPLGVDLSIFKEFKKKEKDVFKKKYKIPKNKFIIGSFQKDGEGWSEGLEPKLVKGPDVFCEVVKKIHSDFNIHVFLTGPARGYVKKKLDEYHIPYTHIFLENYLDIVECYNSLDLYLVASRAEGGPKALLEGMATGVPIVTTNVGMAPDLIGQGINGFITDVEDVDQLYQFSVEILTNKELTEKFIANSLKIVQNYSWEEIAKNYYNKIYKVIARN